MTSELCGNGEPLLSNVIMAVNGSSGGFDAATTTAAAVGFTGEYEDYCDYDAGTKQVATLFDAFGYSDNRLTVTVSIIFRPNVEAVTILTEY